MKKKWYKTNLAKVILIIIAHISAAAAVASFIWILNCPALRTEIFKGEMAKEYKDSSGFSEQMQIYAEHALKNITARDLFETDGSYAPDKLVDVETYYKEREPGSENAGKFSYRIGDLADWAQKMEDGGYDEERQEIVVCKKPDGGYYYYSMAEFDELVRNGGLQFVLTNGTEEISGEDVLSDMEAGYTASEEAAYWVHGKDGEVLYTDCWMYDGESYPELYPPQGAESVLAIANEEPAWNGKLDQAYEELYETIWEIGNEYESYTGESVYTMEEGDTNFTYLYADVETERIYTNKKDYESYGALGESIEKIKSTGSYVMTTPKLSDFKTNMHVDASMWKNMVKSCGPDADDFLFIAAVDTEYPIRDAFYTGNKLYEKYASSAREVGLFGLLAAVLFLACVIWLTVIAGRMDRDDRVHLNWFDRWKTELAAAAVAAGWFFLVAAVISIVSSGNVVGYTVFDVDGLLIAAQPDYVDNPVPYMIAGAALAAFTCGMFLVGFLSLARRMKAGTLWKNSILKVLWGYLKRICGFFKMIFGNMDSIWKIVLVAVGFVFLQFLYASSGGAGFFFFLMLLADGAVFVWLARQAVGKKRIIKGIEEIAGGNVDYQIPLDGLKGDQKKIADEINTIGGGLDAALAESMKSERLKTDLITNVSHDIKTPLTSIINYVELLKRENFEDPKIRRYIEVIEAKSQRLKTLTEDVVEASKISSGNISLEYMNLNLVEMIQPTSGEFEERCQARNLKEVLTLPEGEALIRADGRRTWRILENIYNNVAKYAMEGTRVYADLEVSEKEVSFSLKNISEQPLNIPADELTERFIRGDLSRSTEGSGLGLSIARTLAEMQGGGFQLYLDGDLFKVTITFPRVR